MRESLLREGIHPDYNLLLSETLWTAACSALPPVQAPVTGIFAPKMRDHTLLTMHFAAAAHPFTSDVCWVNLRILVPNPYVTPPLGLHYNGTDHASALQ